jgi:hypothetical protein
VTDDVVEGWQGAVDDAVLMLDADMTSLIAGA